MKLPALVAAVVTVSSIAACGSNTVITGPAPAGSNAPPVTTNPDQGNGVDAGAAPVDVPDAAPPPDNGSVSETYPAFKPETAVLQNNGGLVLSAPVVVTVTWPNEKNVDAFEKFGDTIGPSAYWASVVGEYGVGAATSGPTNHVRTADAGPASISTTDLDTLVATNASAAGRVTSLWPAPTDQTIYILYLPLGTLLDMGGGADACSVGVGGYHDSTQVDGMDVAYAIIPQCGNGPLDESTASASHELAEASLDPHPQSDAGWIGVDDDHIAYDFFQQHQDENGDMCEFYRDSFYTNTEAAFPYSVQRQWSNKSAAAGHAPCTPVAPGAYFNTTPLAVTAIAFDESAFGGSAKQASKGFHVPVGATATFSLGFYSDAAAPEWTISAIEGSPFAKPSSTPHLVLTLDKTKGQNGEKANLTVKVNAAGKTKSEFITIVSSSGSNKHYMPILIGSE